MKTAFCNVLFSLALRFHIAKIVGSPRCARMEELENQLRYSQYQLAHSIGTDSRRQSRRDLRRQGQGLPKTTLDTNPVLLCSP